MFTGGLRRRLRRRRELAVPRRHARLLQFRLGRHVHLHPPPTVRRGHAPGTPAGHRHHRSQGTRRPRRLRDDRPHLAGRFDPALEPGGPVARRQRRPHRPSSTPTGPGGGTTRSMIRGTLANPRIRNVLGGRRGGGVSVHLPAGEPALDLRRRRDLPALRACRSSYWRARSTGRARPGTGPRRASPSSACEPSSSRATSGSTARTSSGWASRPSSSSPATIPQRSGSPATRASMCPAWPECRQAVSSIATSRCAPTTRSSRPSSGSTPRPRRSTTGTAASFPTSCAGPRDLTAPRRAAGFGARASARRGVPLSRATSPRRAVTPTLPGDGAKNPAVARVLVARVAPSVATSAAEMLELDRSRLCTTRLNGGTGKDACFAGLVTALSSCGEQAMSLTSLERAVLDFEREWWTMSDKSSKRDAIRARLEISPARYYAVVSALADSDDAAAYDPLVVHRLRRRRAERRRAAFFAEAPRQRRPH